VDSFRDLTESLRTHICYAHIFGDALTEEQLVARCAPSDPAGVGRGLELLASRGSVERAGEYWFLRGAAVEGFAAVKQRRQQAARRVLEDQRKLLGLLKSLSVVRMLAVSGSIGWRNHVDRVGKPADLDLFVITAPAGVHIVRFVVRVREGLRWLLSRLGMAKGWAVACANYVTEIGFLEITNPSFYTASDALNVQVQKGEDVYQQFLVVNRWIERYYPQVLQGRVDAPATERKNVARAALNLVCFGTMAAYAWTKSRLTGRPFTYSLAFRFDRTNSLSRCAAGGGGYQPVVARRFHEIHASHFGPDPSLSAFLFPGTTESGVYAHGAYAEAPASIELGYDE
jgi:hypothetical protein